MARIKNEVLETALELGLKNDFMARNALQQQYPNNAKSILTWFLKGVEQYKTTLSYVMRQANKKAKVWKDLLGGDLKVYLSIALKEEMLLRNQRLTSM